VPASTSQPKPHELDLGPIRIEGCKFSKNASASGQYTLTLRIGDSVIDIVTSLLGHSVHIYKDDVELHADFSE
jgi:hypothetical protein